MQPRPADCRKGGALDTFIILAICYFCDCTDANARERLTRESVRVGLWNDNGIDAMNSINFCAVKTKKKNNN